MTNVPNEIREMWSDVYKLFDVNYNMPNTPQAWETFWEQAQSIRKKHKDPRFIELIVVVSEMLEDRIKDRRPS